ncbi:CoA ester lyase [Sphingomonas sp. BGYR3]|uniref:HpcH/HpaI aldolase/citrate lyase family protein n=1 Tax=Sphingomonas sp. BGYR3 TaxID=2975483 RepID=UPI0021A3B4E8|nr:CoA ester lyase [Sphingomonas sp. BGYR3]MDG5487789.1 CoA ester lyase [Sphingomonas sp. BGYR3]
MNADASAIASARSLLFVPGDRPDRFDRALSSGADLVIVDLEDAVAPAARTAARDHVRGLVETGARVIVRINGAGTSDEAADRALVDRGGIFGVMLPKAEPGPMLDWIVTRVPLIALIESARGVAAVHQIAATPGVARLALGTIDLANDLGMASDTGLLDPIRLSLTIASRAAGLPPPIDGVCAAFRDTAAMLGEVRRAADLGFSGKLCIHPMQVELVHSALAPDDEAVARARRILAAANAADGKACALDGEMIDAPVVERARLILSRL